MASIARNRAIDVVRKNSETSIEEEPAGHGSGRRFNPDPLARREMTEELKRLLECVGRLEPDRQKLVLLAYYNGWSREQLAAKFETPVNTVKTSAAPQYVGYPGVSWTLRRWPTAKTISRSPRNMRSAPSMPTSACRSRP